MDGAHAAFRPLALPTSAFVASHSYPLIPYIPAAWRSRRHRPQRLGCPVNAQELAAQIVKGPRPGVRLRRI